MGHRSKSAARCTACRMHTERCLCDEMPHFALATRLALVMHCRELKKTTATGPLALSTLSNSELYVHGRPERPLDLTHLSQQGRRLLLLFPSEEAVPLDLWCSSMRSSDPRPVTLVVPDGNWRQASRVAKRVTGLELAEAVTLPPGPPTRWGIRRETKEGGLATFEAIARALGFLESVRVQSQLEDFFHKTVRTTWETRTGRPFELDAEAAEG